MVRQIRLFVSETPEPSNPEVRDCWFDDESWVAWELGLSQAELGQILEERQLIEQIRQCLDEVVAIAFGALSSGAVADYLHHGYGLRLWDQFTKSHYYYPIFPQGTPYPCRRSLVLQVANPEQTEIHLETRRTEPIPRENSLRSPRTDARWAGAG